MDARARFRVPRAAVTLATGLLIGLSAALLFTVLPRAHLSIGTALVVVIATVWLAAQRLIGGRDFAPLDDIGFWYLGIIGLYAAIPLAAVLALRLQYTPINDLRLFELQPSAAAVARVAWLYALYVVTFAAVYVTFRGRLAETGQHVRLRGSLVLAAGVTYLMIQGLLLALSMQFDVAAEGYLAQYRAMQSLPLFARQLFKLLIGLRFVVVLILLLWLMTRVRFGVWLAFAWLAAQVWLALTQGGSRTELMLSGAVVFIMYHRTIRPVRLRTAVVGGLVAVVLFLALGILRDLQNLAERGGVFGMHANEFEGVFANAIDLQDRKARGELAGAGAVVAFSDIVAVVPSQLTPFQKDNAADWYLRTFYPTTRESGGGMAFGAISQAVVGWGWYEVIIRASIVALGFALWYRIYRTRADRAWVIVLNAWAIVWAYESFRVTTFYTLHIFVQQFVVAFVLLEVGRRVLVGASAAGSGIVAAGVSSRPA